MIVVAPRFLNFIRWMFGIKMQIGGLAILPFIFVPDKDCKKNKQLINHERIHLRQQVELLFFVFIIWYFIALYRKTYMGISFEREAYQNQNNLNYLKTRPWFAFLKYRK
ncbi:MAG: hypothetical protein AABY15_02130 [Nanoarchaeota archaeon]